MLIVILTGSLVATTAMTLFSYIVAYLSNSNFKEPELLNILLNNSQLPISPSKKSIVGWSGHYILGLIFGLIFYMLFTYTPLNISIFNCIWYGIAAGIMGIIGWEIMFRISRNPPKIKLRSFYIQLIIAHLLFGIFIGITLYVMSK